MTKCISPGIKRGLYFHISPLYPDYSGLVDAVPTGAHVNIMSMRSMLGGHRRYLHKTHANVRRPRGMFQVLKTLLPQYVVIPLKCVVGV